jgi:hyperosmotically inducible periplasmic protein
VANRKHASILAAAVCTAFAGNALGADAGKAIDDSYITSKVKAELTADSATKARHISVNTKDGVVALTGTVGSRAEKQKAEQDARDVKGVVDVINKLQVRE